MLQLCFVVKLVWSWFQDASMFSSREQCWRGWFGRRNSQRRDCLLSDLHPCSFPPLQKKVIAKDCIKCLQRALILADFVKSSSKRRLWMRLLRCLSWGRWRWEQPYLNKDARSMMCAANLHFLNHTTRVLLVALLAAPSTSTRSSTTSWWPTTRSPPTTRSRRTTRSSPTTARRSPRPQSWTVWAGENAY